MLDDQGLERPAPGPVEATTRPLRVLWVIKCLGYGGAERLLVDMVAAVDRDQFAYEVAYVLRDQDALVSLVEQAGTTVHALGATHNVDLRWLVRLRKLLSRRRYDVVHFHLPYTAALGQLVVHSLPRAKRPGVVYTEHSLWDHTPITIRALMRLSMGGGQRLVTVSQAAQDALPARLRPRSRIVVHGVDLSRSDSLMARRTEIQSMIRAEVGARVDEFLFITVANLRPEKGYDVLLDAAHMLADRQLPIRIIAVGRGPLDAALKARHRDLGLGDRFRFLGQRDDVLRLLVGADAFVLASRQEGLPVALMEATSVGLPIVATAVGGVPQVLTDGVSALVVPPNQPVALADAMARVASDAALRERLGREARVRSDMFDITQASKTVGEVHLSVRPNR